MKSQLRIPLHTSPEQAARLQALQTVFAQAGNSIAPLVQQTGIWNRVALHHLAYKALRAKYPAIGSQMACNVIYLRDTLKVTTYVVGLMDYTTPATDSYRKYMNALAVAGGGKCASEVLGGSDCAYEQCAETAHAGFLHWVSPPRSRVAGMRPVGIREAECRSVLHERTSTARRIR